MPNKQVPLSMEDTIYELGHLCSTTMLHLNGTGDMFYLIKMAALVIYVLLLVIMRFFLYVE